MPRNPALLGRHQAMNIAAAAMVAFVRGAPVSAIARGLEFFRGVEDRMEPVAEIEGVTYVNDTSATAPAATVAALDCFPGRRIHLISGGAEKRTDLRPLVEAARRRAHVVYLLDGSVTAALQAQLATAGVSTEGPFGSMDEAVASARSGASAGDVVLLSPGCASFGLFRDEFDRGAQFRAAVAAFNTSIAEAKRA
jgi:UDP-N-acetylmuramoylalanine--D-glutamate ligase